MITLFIPSSFQGVTYNFSIEIPPRKTLSSLNIQSKSYMNYKTNFTDFWFSTNFATFLVKTSLHIYSYGCWDEASWLNKYSDTHENFIERWSGRKSKIVQENGQDTINKYFDTILISKMNALENLTLFRNKLENFQNINLGS